MNNETTPADVERETKALRASTERLYQERITLEAETLALEELLRKQAHLNRQIRKVLALECAANCVAL